MTRYPAILTACIIFLILFSIPVHAENEELPEIDCFSAGFGIDWGGIGVNYLTLDEGSDFGFSAGVGWLGTGMGASAFLVGRFGDPDYGLFLGYGGTNATVGYAVPSSWSSVDGSDTVGSVFLGYGNLPTDSGEFMWRINLGMDKGDDPFPWVSLGVSL